MNQQTPLNNLTALVELFNAALEHVPATTKGILGSLAQPHVQALQQHLTPRPAPKLEGVPAVVTPPAP